MKKHAIEFSDISSLKGPNGELNKREMERALRLSISAEQDAVHLYELIADKSPDSDIKKIMQDVANEEKVHIGEFQKLLKSISEDEEKFLKEGEREVKKKLKTSAETRERLKQVIKTNLENIDKFFPKAKEEVDGRKVGSFVHNQDSIEATIEDPKILPGIREVDLSWFDDYTLPNKDRKTMDLVEKIKENNKIDPLIIAVDDEGLYVLEGSHRYDALRIIGAKSFPAMVVLEEGSLNLKVAKELIKIAKLLL